MVEIVINIIIKYFLIINICVFILIGLDKFCEKNTNFKISDQLIFLLGFLGGALGGLCGMYIFNHHTDKRRFHIVFIFEIVIHIVLVISAIQKWDIVFLRK